MSKENLDQFIQKVTDSADLQAKIGEEIDAEALIALGAECGCEFTAEELQESVELSDEELDAVAGGFGKSTPKLSSRASSRGSHDINAQRNVNRFTANITGIYVEKEFEVVTDEDNYED